MISQKIIGWLLKEFNLSEADVQKVKSILDKIDIKTTEDGKTIISVRLEKASVILEGEKNVY